MPRPVSVILICVAALISVPLQFNYDSGFGLDGDGDRWLLNVQPVIPFSISDDWNLISRTILPVIHQEVPSGGPDWGARFIVTLLYPK